MELYEKIRARVKGSAEEKERRDTILSAVLSTFQQGGPEAATDFMKSRLDEMEKKLKEKLEALKKKL